MLRLLLTAVVVTSTVVVAGVALRGGDPGHRLRPVAAVASGTGTPDPAPAPTTADGPAEDWPAEDWPTEDWPTEDWPTEPREGRPTGGTAAAPDLAGAEDSAGSTAQHRAARLVARWDRRRAAAWALGDAERLASLYVEGSSAGRHDVAMLRAWTARGLRVRGMATRLLDVDVLDVRAAGRRAGGRDGGAVDRVRLRVVDRLVGARAVGRGVAVPLPRDRATAREVTLLRTRGGWLVAEVVPA